MKKSVFTKITSLFLLLLFLFSSVGCDSVEPTPNNRVFDGAFDTVSVIWDYSGMESEKFNKLADDIEESAKHYHRLFDAYTEYEGINNLATINRLAGKGAVKVNSAIIDLLEFSREMYDKTGAEVNFAFGAVTYLWKTLPATEERIPTDAELDEAAKHTDPSLIVINKAESTVEIQDPALRIDVGAIAKGYTAQLIKHELKALGYNSIVLDFGGNLCAVGSKPNGKGFESTIHNPLYGKGGNDRYIRDITLSDTALVTSGGYERYYVIDGVKYHHIIDPQTKKPLNNYLSVSVLTENSGVADALSTAIFNMDIDTAESFISSYGERIEVTIVFPDGSYKVLSSR